MTRQLVALFLAIGTAWFAPAPHAGAVDASAAVEAWQADPTTIFEASEVDLDAFRWIARPIIVFADTPANPAFERQLEYLEERIGELARRDVVVIVDAEPEAGSDLRRRMRPREFMLVLMDKAGDVVTRKPSPWDVREITRSIDKTPERQRELREGRDALTD